MIVTHSNDGDGDNPGNLMKVEAADWPSNATRAVLRGEIPQVSHTFGYFTEGYAVMNEHSVSLGESTCSSVYAATVDGQLNIIDLGKLGLERAATARGAVETMGALAERYGYSDAGESLLVGDPTEAWIFHVLPDSTGTGAIWAALRVPDDSAAAVMNSFTIRALPLDDNATALYSTTLITEAEALGWDGSGASGQPDFTLLFSGANNDGAPTCKYYSGRRMWRVYDALAPSLNLSAYYGNYTLDAPLPPTVVVEEAPRKANATSVEGFLKLMRDDFEGTEFDLTKVGLTGAGRLAAGPWGSPDRWANDPTVCFERPMGTFKSSCSFVAQSGGGGGGGGSGGSGGSGGEVPAAVAGTVFFGLDAAKTTVYVPFFAGQPGPVLDAFSANTNRIVRPGAAAAGASAAAAAVAAAGEESGHGGGSGSLLDLVGSGYWAQRVLHNLVQLHYADMIQDVAAAQALWEAKGLRLRDALAEAYAEGRLDGGAMGLRDALAAHAANATRAFWRLGDALLEAYADGFCTGCSAGDGNRHLGYPQWWIDAVYDPGEFDQPPVAVAAPAPPSSQRRERGDEWGR